MDTIFPSPLRKGDTVGIVAPSSYIEADKLDAGVEVLREFGFHVRIHPQTLARENQSAGSIAEKIAAIHEMFVDPDIKAIFAAGGGNRSAHILKHLDYTLIRHNPKPYIGFSDSTALLCGFASKSGLSAFHGPVVKWMPKMESGGLDFLFSLLAGHQPHYPFEEAMALREGAASGPLLGGNLGVICSLIGTDYFPSSNGAILFLEDTNEELSRIDRMLWHLREALPFSSLQGIIFGQFSNARDTGRPFGYSLEDIFLEHTADLAIPVIMNASFGHEAQFYSLPFLCPAKLDVSASGISFRLSRSAVKI